MVMSLAVGPQEGRGEGCIKKMLMCGAWCPMVGASGPVGHHAHVSEASLNQGGKQLEGPKTRTSGARAGLFAGHDTDLCKGEVTYNVGLECRSAAWWRGCTGLLWGSGGVGLENIRFQGRPVYDGRGWAIGKKKPCLTVPVWKRCTRKHVG